MSTLLILTAVSLILAAIPALLFRVNLRAYMPPPDPLPDAILPPVSVLIPARDEAASIGPAVRSILSNIGVDFEVVVLDDHSEDQTASIVQRIAEADPRVRLVSAPELPSGWCGKQHACWVLAREARHHVFVFLDADVRLEPDALARMDAFLMRSGADLASGIPAQQTVGLMERMVIPLIHFILLGFLPISRMRRSSLPSLSAGCGQLFIARRAAYDRAGGHAAIRESLHDGIRLPRAFRSAGCKTDLFDATDLATCRMYRTAREVWFGLAKNAGEALAAPGMIVPMSAILLGGQVLPPLLLLLGLASWPRPWPWWQLVLALAATFAAYYPRLASITRYRQSATGALLHPLGILTLLAIQWYAFVRNFMGRPSTWKGRPYATPGAGLPVECKLEHAAIPASR